MATYHQSNVVFSRKGSDMKFVKPRNLKPCPLCGTKSILAVHDGGSPVNVSCGVKDDESDSCGLVLFGSNGSTRKSMIEKWNEREVI